MSPAAGQLVTETFEFDGGRQVTVYVPAASPESVVFAGDGGWQPPAVMPSPLPRVYLAAGTLEPFFLKNARRWAVALRDAGADVVMTKRAGPHDGAFWAEEFPLMVAWAFGR